MPNDRYDNPGPPFPRDPYVSPWAPREWPQRPSYGNPAYYPFFGNVIDRSGGVIPTHPHSSGTGGRGGYADINGNIDQSTGDYDDSPHYGDWLRHSTGESGIPGGEGYGFPGSNTWGESVYQQEGRELYGPHRGKGPKGYRRSDARIEEDVNEALTWHPYLDAEEIEVKVKDGIVTLTGRAEDRQAKRLAEAAADRVRGVKDVENRLEIGR